MSLRSIWEIDVQDEKFQAFRKQFDHYQSLLSNSPKEWKKVTDSIGGTRSAFEALVASQMASIARTKLMAEAQKEAVRRTETLADKWHKLSHSAKSFAGHISDATRFLLRWGSLTGLASGLLSAGSLFGIDRLAWAASNGLRSSQGLGLSFGEQQAFGVNFSRLVDPNSFLGGVNEALHDVTKRYAFAGAGLSEADLAGKDTAQVASALIPKLKELADKYSPSQYAQLIQARGLGNFGVTVQELERLHATSWADLNRYRQQYAADQRGLNIPAAQLRAWQALQVQLSRAGQQIENTFIRGLTPLAPEIAKLSGAFSDAVRIFLGSPEIKRDIDLLAGALRDGAKYLASGEFQKNIQTAAADVGQFGAKVLAVAKWLESVVPGKAAAGAAAGAVAGGYLGGPAGAAAGAAAGYGYERSQNIDPHTFNKPAKPSPFSWWEPWTWYHHTPGTGPWDAQDSGIKKSAWITGPAGGISPDLLQRVAYTESGYNPNAYNAKSGAKGEFQFTDATWAEWGHGSPYDPRAAADAASRYLTALMQQFGGSVEKALAAYNWGPGNVQRDIAQHGNQWRAYLPAETQNYLEKILGNRRSHPGIVVQDRTGGSVTISAAQLAV